MKKIIYLHGALGCSNQARELTRSLNFHFDCFSTDFTGHGFRPAYFGDLSIDLFTMDLYKFMDELEIVGADLVGYSMGGYVALNYARKYPDRVGKIFTFGTKFDWNPESALREAKMLNPQKILEKVPKFANELQELHGDKWERLVEQTAEMMLNLGSNPILTPEELSKIQNSVYISVGDKDSMITIEESANAFRSLPNARFTVFPSTIHQITKIDLMRLRNELVEFFG
jgi:pimeloyl-ACP methyl ester carboxylesterase